MRIHYDAEAHQETENLNFLTRTQAVSLTTQANLRAIITTNKLDRDALDAAVSAVKAQQTLRAWVNGPVPDGNMATHAAKAHVRYILDVHASEVPQ
jgi:hypothetical protein